jgi:hypothetical protein
VQDDRNPYEGDAAEKADGLGGSQEVPEEEGQGEGARLDQAAPTPEKQMEQEGPDNPRTSTGTNPAPGHSTQSPSAADGEPTADEDS